MEEQIIKNEHDEISCDICIIGGGVSSGYFFQELSEIKKSLKNAGYDEFNLNILCISLEPKGLYPYERPALSKGALNPSNDSIRNYLSIDNENTFPWTCKGEKKEGQNEIWYKNENYNFLFGYIVSNVNLDDNYLISTPIYDDAALIGTIKKKTTNDQNNLHMDERFHAPIQIYYNKLIISTGVRARIFRDLGDSTPPVDPLYYLKQQARANQQDLAFTKTNIDYISGLNVHGSRTVHLLRDLHDCCRLVQAIRNRIMGDIDNSFDPILIVGGGFLGIEVASQLLQSLPNERQIILLLHHEHILTNILSPELATFYENKLKEKGLIIARNMKARRLWHDDERGEFMSIKVWNGEGTRGGFTTNNEDEETIRGGFTRGIVVDHYNNDNDIMELYIPGAFVFLSIGSIPNSSLFEDDLELLDDGSIPVNEYYLTAHPSDNVYAIGDVASALTFNNIYNNNDDNNSNDFNHYQGMEHVHFARHSARMVCRHIMATYLPEYIEFEPFPFHSYRYSRFLNFSWKLYGESYGKCIIKGINEYINNESDTFLGIWVDGPNLYNDINNNNNDDDDDDNNNNNEYNIYTPYQIVGIFIEGGNDEIWSMIKELVEAKPLIQNLENLENITWQEYLENPYSISPQEPQYGSFPMEDNPNIIKTKFLKYNNNNNDNNNNNNNLENNEIYISIEYLPKLMNELGADWNEEETMEAINYLDENNENKVSLEKFLEWWLN